MTTLKDILTALQAAVRAYAEKALAAATMAAATEGTGG